MVAARKRVAAVAQRGPKVRKILAFSPVTVSRHLKDPPVDRFRPLKESSSGDTAIPKFLHAVLPQGVTGLILEAVTLPPEQPAQWEVQPNQNASPAPAFDVIEGGRKIVLHTDQVGGFSVLARLNPHDKPIVWNVVFVGVSVRSTSVAAKSNYRGLPFADLNVVVSTGDAPGGVFAWTASAEIRLTGGGPGHDIGIDTVEIDVLQNGLTDSVTASYANKDLTKRRDMSEVLAFAPVLDTDDQSGDLRRHFSSPTNALAVRINPRTGPLRNLTALDAPNTVAFPSALDAKGGGVRKGDPRAEVFLHVTSGVMKFRTAIAAISRDAPDAIAVYATLDWECDVDGSVIFKTLSVVPGAPIDNVPDWQGSGTVGTRSAPAWSVITATDANAAGMEVWPPNFIASVKLK